MPLGDKLVQLTPIVAADELLARLERAERRVARERAARMEAEAIAERGLRDLYDSQRRLELLQRITTGANETSKVRDALRLAATEVCSFMGWAFGNALLRDGENTVVGCDTWCAEDPDRLQPFIQGSRTCRFMVGQGLPGRVLATGQPLWIEDVRVDANFPRAPLAEACGLIAACSFPVLVGNEVGAVLEFFSHQRLDQDERVIAIMAQVGTQIGRVIERDRSQRALLHDALHDPLTGLPNRVLFGERLRAAHARTRFERPDAMATMVIDLDGFKTVNDTLGHSAGDDLLSEVARRLSEQLDVAGRASSRDGVAYPWRATLARMGGDEFTVLLEDLPHPHIAEQVAADLHRVLRTKGDEEAGSALARITASIGIAHGHARYPDGEALLRDADLAMYQAKSNGRNCTVAHDEAVGRRFRERLTIEQDLRGAIYRRELMLHYQPIVSLEGENRVAGFEALVRWRHPKRGIVPPGEFIEIAEQTGLILPLGDWVLREACRQAAVWRDTLPAEISRFYVSVNVSPRQFLERDFARRVAAVLRRTGLDPALLRLEITEGAAIRDPQRTRVVLAQLRGWGVKISLDDFGTGYSSLSHLQHLPFDVLKIDRSFVVDMLESSAGAGIVRAILELARTMGMSVVAEGIERAEQAKALRALGCGHGQGYLYNRPMAADAVTTLFMTARGTDHLT